MMSKMQAFYWYLVTGHLPSRYGQSLRFLCQVNQEALKQNMFETWLPW